MAHLNQDIVCRELVTVVLQWAKMRELVSMRWQQVDVIKEQ